MLGNGSNCLLSGFNPAGGAVSFTHTHTAHPHKHEDHTLNPAAHSALDGPHFLAPPFMNHH